MDGVPVPMETGDQPSVPAEAKSEAANPEASTAVTPAPEHEQPQPSTALTKQPEAGKAASKINADEPKVFSADPPDQAARNRTSERSARSFLCPMFHPHPALTLLVGVPSARTWSSHCLAVLSCGCRMHHAEVVYTHDRPLLHTPSWRR